MNWEKFWSGRHGMTHFSDFRQIKRRKPLQLNPVTTRAKGVSGSAAGPVSSVWAHQALHRTQKTKSKIYSELHKKKTEIKERMQIDAETALNLATRNCPDDSKCLFLFWFSLSRSSGFTSPQMASNCPFLIFFKFSLLKVVRLDEKGRLNLQMSCFFLHSSLFSHWSPEVAGIWKTSFKLSLPLSSPLPLSWAWPWRRRW